jgi:hypothetical protein
MPMNLFRPRGATIASALIAALVAIGCTVEKNPQPSSVPGADLDAVVCKPSTGYRWCARLNSCQRPWELAQRENIPTSSVDAYCSEKPSQR